MTAIPKPTATADRAKRKRAQQAKDRRESAKVKVRSGGHCEIVTQLGIGAYPTYGVPCYVSAVHVHHMIKGRGKRAVGASLLAIHKQHACTEHHRGIEGGIGGKRLILIQRGELPVWDDVYRRIR